MAPLFGRGTIDWIVRLPSILRARASRLRGLAGGRLPAVASALLVALATLALAAPPAVAAPVAAPHVEVELVSEVASVRPGEPFQAGLRFVLEDGWHVYWRNPGDSGLAPEVAWHLPAGVTAGEIQWPHPHRISVGPLTNFGYEGEVLLPVTITPSRELEAGERLRLAAHAEWLVCEEDCIPGEADLAHELPVADGPPAPGPAAPLFAATRDLLPRAPDPLELSAQRSGDTLALRVTAPDGQVVRGSPPGDPEVVFFPADPQHIENAAPQPVARDSGGVALALATSQQRQEPIERLRGILVAPAGFAPDGAQAVSVDVPVRAAAAVAAAGGGATAVATGGAAATGVVAGEPEVSSFWLAIGLAFLGGLLLNVMPCVFPVLSIKILDFVRQAGDSAGRLRGHGLVYAAGVLLSFWVLAGALLALRAAGESLGWGFQLQSPAFVVAMIFLLFALALSLLGLYDVGIGMTAVGGRAQQRAGLAGSFATGVLATVVATPCTAPFMGPALGFALTLSALGALLVFTALGAGMALPYVALCYAPGWLRLLPRPGAWLETFKQLMAFPLFATVVWLVWVLGLQAGVDAILGVLAGLLLVALALWLRARFLAPATGPRTRRVVQAVSVLLVLGGLATGLAAGRAPAAGGSGREGGWLGTADPYGIAWRDYSDATLASLREAGTPVFVDFTAAWCLTCKVNEHVVFSSDEVREAFAARGVAMLRADWTSRDAEITRALASFGRSGVPLYVLYGSQPGGPPQILPSVLTRGIVLDALGELG